MFIFNCYKCNSTMNIDLDTTINEYIKILSDKKLVYPVEKSPIKFDFVFMNCSNMDCKNLIKINKEELLNKSMNWWSELAWSYYLQEEKTKFNFQEYFTRYILVKGLNKFVTKRDIDNNKVLKDYIKYVEGKLTEGCGN